jgi:hypothetical protein
MSPDEIKKLIEDTVRHEINVHVHGVNARKNKGKYLENAPQTAIAPVLGTPDGTYSANEQTLITDQTTAINSIIVALQNLGLLE